MMPGIIELGSDPDLAPRDAGVLDSLADLFFIAVGQCGINVAIPGLQRNFDSMRYLVRSALPCSKTDGWNLIAGVKGEGFPVEIRVSHATFSFRRGVLILPDLRQSRTNPNPGDLL